VKSKIICAKWRPIWHFYSTQAIHSARKGQTVRRSRWRRI